MSASTSTTDRAEINRRNATKSTGPRTASGKQRSRMNAAKHGMTASLPVLPGENVDVFQARREGWVDTLQPRNDVEQFLVEQAVQTSWQLERVQRAHVARLTESILEATDPTASPAEKEEVARLGRRLFWDRGGPIELYPNKMYVQSHSTNTSWSGIVDDPDDPARLVIGLEATLTGCEWMIERWIELRERLLGRQCWTSCDKLKAIRLLGKQPLDAVNDYGVATILITADAVNPQYTSPFSEVKCDVPGPEFEIYNNIATWRAPDLGLPKDPYDASVRGREILKEFVEGAIGQLQAKADVHRQRIARRAAMAPALLGFDTSPEGERLRRYETSCGRQLMRTLAQFQRMHRASETDGEPVEAFGFLADIADAMPMCELVPDIIDPDTFQANESVPATEQPIWRNGANWSGDDECMSRADESAACSDEAKLRNEPRPASGNGCTTGADEPVAGNAGAKLRNELRPIAGGACRVESGRPRAGVPLSQQKRNFLPACKEAARNRKQRRLERRQPVGT